VGEDLFDSDFERIYGEDGHGGCQSIGEEFFITGDERLELCTVEDIVDMSSCVARWQIECVGAGCWIVVRALKRTNVGWGPLS